MSTKPIYTVNRRNTMRLSRDSRLVRLRPDWSRVCCAFIVTFGFFAVNGLAWGQFGGRGANIPKLPSSNDEKSRGPRIPYFEPATKTTVKEVVIVGNTATPKSTIEGMLQTRVERIYDPEVAQADVRRLHSSKMFHDVRHYKKDVPGGVSVTFEVFERPTVAYVRYIGNEKIKDKHLNKEIGLKEGDPLHRYSVEEGRRRIEEKYLEKGYTRVHVEVIEGLNPNDKGVAYKIHEGPRQRIAKTTIVGNNIDSDGRLKTKIQSKPGFMWLFGGKINPKQVEEDEARLRDYYHSLGFFLVRVTPEVEYDEDNKWATVTFVVDEGPRYRVRNVTVNGNKKYDNTAIMGPMMVKSGDYFNLARLQTDLNMVRDLYGSQGHIFADIQANPRFLGDSGELDLVYNIEEGEQYRVGQIHVNIEGDQAHTRHSVVLNRLSLSPGDIIDVREIRSSERRLQASELFETNPSQGPPPRIVVKPREGEEAIASQPDEAGEATFRGQSTTRFRLPIPLPTEAPVVDLQILGKLR